MNVEVAIDLAIDTCSSSPACQPKLSYVCTFTVMFIMDLSIHLLMFFVALYIILDGV